MKQHYSRRHFIRQSTVISAGLSLCSTQVISAFNSPLGQGSNVDILSSYKDIRTSVLKNKSVCVSGVVYDKNSLKPKSNTLLKVWHRSAFKDETDINTLLKTSMNGSFKILTNLPPRDLGKSGRLFFQVNPNKYSKPIELIINNIGAHIMSSYWESCDGLDNELVPITKTTFFSHKIAFNLFV